MNNLFDNLHFIIGFAFFIGLIIVGVKIVSSSKSSTSNSINQRLLEKFSTILTPADLQTFQVMNEQMKMQFMQDYFNQMQTEQLNETFIQMNLQQQEIDRLMATGIEFGGFNTDINLNPGMQMEQQHQMDMMNHMNDNNNFGGPGMF